MSLQLPPLNNLYIKPPTPIMKKNTAKPDERGVAAIIILPISSHNIASNKTLFVLK